MNRRLLTNNMLTIVAGSFYPLLRWGHEMNVNPKHFKDFSH